MVVARGDAVTGECASHGAEARANASASEDGTILHIALISCSSCHPLPSSCHRWQPLPSYPPPFSAAPPPPASKHHKTNRKRATKQNASRRCPATMTHLGLRFSQRNFVVDESVKSEHRANLQQKLHYSTKAVTGHTPVLRALKLNAPRWTRRPRASCRWSAE
jgi:hypothetical protein